MIDKLLGLKLVDDIAETSWWTDTIFRGLEQDRTEEQGLDLEDPARIVTSPD
jgi:hypothetical protein